MQIYGSKNLREHVCNAANVEAGWLQSYISLESDAVNEAKCAIGGARSEKCEESRVFLQAKSFAIDFPLDFVRER